MTLGLIATVASEAGISAASARRIAQSAPHRYKVFSIPKKGGGMRVVAQPAREVKALQRTLVAYLTPLLPLHDAATAYRKHTSIRQNAERHSSCRYLLKLDFEAFFPSIDREAIRNHLLGKCPNKFSDAEIEFVSNLTLWLNKEDGNRGLCIGAPSSPFLSNTIMFDFDTAVSRECGKLGVIYTRYSDDLTFSTSAPDTLSRIEARVREICRELTYPRLTFNDRKRVNVSRRSALHVTGLTLANQGHVTVGRNRKRGVRAGLNRYLKGMLEESEIESLRGEIAFAVSVEPGFRETLRRLYKEKCSALLPR